MTDKMKRVGDAVATCLAVVTVVWLVVAANVLLRSLILWEWEWYPGDWGWAFRLWMVAVLLWVASALREGDW